MNLIKKIYYQLFCKKTYRFPTKEEIKAIDFEHHETLEDLLRYDQGKIKGPSATRPGGLKDYCQKRGLV